MNISNQVKHFITAKKFNKKQNKKSENDKVPFTREDTKDAKTMLFEENLKNKVEIIHSLVLNLPTKYLLLGTATKIGENVTKFYNNS